jgi:lipopolysaccharide transport system ATP-binding protein
MPTDAPILEVSGVSKRFCRDLGRSLRYAVADIGRELILRPPDAAGLRPGEFFAIRDVSFHVAAGEAVAVLGSNGAGKTTLLKVLYGLIKPDAGSVSVQGQVGALIELGTGFEPVLTGRENILVNAMMLGLDERQLSDLVERVVDFAEIEDAVDAPVRYYSSGMVARLAFAVAAHLKPSVLLIDEVLAVGDIAFQRKCLSHIRTFLNDGGALVFVSHNPYQVQSVCTSAILLVDGEVAAHGPVVETMARHLADQSAVAIAAQRPIETALDEKNPVVIDHVAMPPDGSRLASGQDAMLTVSYRARQSPPVMWGFNIWAADGWVCVTGDADMVPRTLADGSGQLTCTIPRLPLVSGRYAVSVAIVDASTLHPIASVGYDTPPVPVVVEAATSILSNSFVGIQQMVTVDVHWS